MQPEMLRSGLWSVLNDEFDPVLSELVRSKARFARPGCANQYNPSIFAQCSPKSLLYESHQ